MVPENISDALRDAMDRHASAGRMALEAPGLAVSYATLCEAIDRAAAGVQSWGDDRGEPVGILGPRGLSTIAAFFGAMHAGACPCPIEPGLSAETLAERMQAVGMRHLILDPALLTDASALVATGVRIHALADLSGDTFHPIALRAKDRAMMLFTSGSTGRPKGVVLSQANLACNARGVIAHTNLTADDRLLHVMPLFHTNGINNQVIAPFLVGATVLLIDRFSPEECPDLIRTLRPTYMTGVPTIYARMLSRVSNRESFASLRFLRCGSAPITVALHEQIEAGFGIPLVVSYGLSEATCTSTMNPPNARRIGSIGTVLQGQTVKLFAPATTHEVARDGEGEICVGGPSLMLGYLGAGGEQPIQDGWLRTGDLGRFDEDGYLSITGRIKDVIIRGGENISPQLIESVFGDARKRQSLLHRRWSACRSRRSPGGIRRVPRRVDLFGGRAARPYRREAVAHLPSGRLPLRLQFAGDRSRQGGSQTASRHACATVEQPVATATKQHGRRGLSWHQPLRIIVFMDEPSPETFEPRRCRPRDRDPLDLKATRPSCKIAHQSRQPGWWNATRRLRRTRRAAPPGWFEGRPVRPRRFPPGSISPEAGLHPRWPRSGRRSHPCCCKDEPPPARRRGRSASVRQFDDGSCYVRAIESARPGNRMARSRVAAA